MRVVLLIDALVGSRRSGGWIFIWFLILEDVVHSVVDTTHLTLEEILDHLVIKKKSSPPAHDGAFAKTFRRIF